MGESRDGRETFERVVKRYAEHDKNTGKQRTEREIRAEVQKVATQAETNRDEKRRRGQ